MLNAKLVVVGGGDAKVSEFKLQLPTTIGRSREAKLKLPHPLVSRQHCEVFERDGQLFVRDLGSLNGTYVDSQKIESEQPLQPNQLLTLGTVTFRAIYENATTDDHPPRELQTDSMPSSEQPTDRAEVEPHKKPIHRPTTPQSEIETENDRAASDTDSNLPAVEQVDLLETVVPPTNLTAGESSIFSSDGVPSSNGSVAHHGIVGLPTDHESLGEVGGLQREDGTVTQPVPAAATSLPVTETGGEDAARDNSVKRRPR